LKLEIQAEWKGLENSGPNSENHQQGLENLQWLAGSAVEELVPHLGQ
jgi:hypothetical protein